MMGYENQYLARYSSLSSSRDSIETSSRTPEQGTALDFTEESKVSSSTDEISVQRKSPNRLLLSSEKRKRKQLNCIENLSEICEQIGNDMKSHVSSKKSNLETKQLKEKRRIVEAELVKVEKEKELEVMKAKRVKGEIIALWLQQGRDMNDFPADLL